MKNSALYTNTLRAKFHDAQFITEDIEDMFRKLKKTAPKWLEPGVLPDDADFAAAVQALAKINDTDRATARIAICRDPVTMFEMVSAKKKDAAYLGFRSSPAYEAPRF